MDNEITVSKLKEEDEELIRKHFFRTFSLFNGYVLQDEFQARMNSILDMDVKDDDIWVCSFPKAGTTWTQEMVWCIANDLNFEEARIPLPQRYIFLDACFLMAPSLTNGNLLMQNKLKEMLLDTEKAKEERTRRFIKTHLPYDLLPRKLRYGSTKAKIVYVARNPRDTCISSFYHRILMARYRGDLEQYCTVFLKGLVSFGPFWKHVLGYWNQRNNQSLLFIKFEEMKNDLPSIIRKTSEYLKGHINEDGIDMLCEHLSFGSMKNNPSVNVDSWTEMVKKMNNPNGTGSFFRLGEIEQWKKDLKPEIIEEFEKWEFENLQKVSLEYYSSL